MKSVAQVKRWPHAFGGEVHEGWLPDNVAAPLSTPVTPVVLDLQILSVDDAFILEWCTRDHVRRGDTWHKTIDDAKTYAENYFGVPKERWG